MNVNHISFVEEGVLRAPVAKTDKGDKVTDAGIGWAVFPHTSFVASFTIFVDKLH